MCDGFERMNLVLAGLRYRHEELATMEGKGVRIMVLGPTRCVDGNEEGIFQNASGLGFPFFLPNLYSLGPSSICRKVAFSRLINEYY